MRRILAGIGVALLLVGSAGCIGPEPAEPLKRGRGGAPVFASDEEALAAAEAAYAAYLAVSDAIFNEGGTQAERLAAVATGDFLEASIAGFQKVQAKGWRSTGRSAVHSIELQQFDGSGRDRMVIVYLCDDVSAVDVLDSDGLSVVSPDRHDRTLFEVSFDLDRAVGRLLISSREVWGDGKC
jgi:hypothetical protein